MPDPAPASPTSGDSANAPTVTVTPQPAVTAGGDDNAGLLADLEAELAGKGAPAQPTGAGKKGAAPTAAPAAEPADESDEEPVTEQTATEDDDESADEVPLEDEDVEDDEPAVDPDEDDPAIAAEADKDPALKARLDAVRRTEERQRARLTAERQTFEQERQQFIADRREALQRIQRFDALAARAKYDLPSVVRQLGIEPADFEYHAQSLMAHSPKFADKAEYRQAQERAMREREAADKAEAAARKVADLESKLEARDQQSAAERELDTYFARTMRKATDATPITAALIKNGPKAARAALTVTANDLVTKLGRLPNATELLAAQEKKEARALQLRGIKPAAKVAAAPAANGVDGTKPATNGGAKPTAPAKPGKKPAAAAPVTPAPAAGDPNRVPTRDEILQELASGAAAN